jgi:hypothetical protein
MPIDQPRLNAVGKPYSASFDPKYKPRFVRTTTAHLYAPYPPTMRWVGSTHGVGPQKKPRAIRAKPVVEPSEPGQLSWSLRIDNQRRAKAHVGYYVISPCLGLWSVDHRQKSRGAQRQLGFADTIEAAKALAQRDQDDIDVGGGTNGRA